MEFKKASALSQNLILISNPRPVIVKVLMGWKTKMITKFKNFEAYGYHLTQ